MQQPFNYEYIMIYDDHAYVIPTSSYIYTHLLVFFRC